MFTIKLMEDGRTRLVEAAGVTVYRYENGSAQITAHMPGAADDAAYFVGQPPGSSGLHFYQMAFIENAMGKTTERVFQLPSGAYGMGREGQFAGHRLANPHEKTGGAMDETPPEAA